VVGAVHCEVVVVVVGATHSEVVVVVGATHSELEEDDGAVHSEVVVSAAQLDDGAADDEDSFHSELDDDEAGAHEEEALADDEAVREGRGKRQRKLESGKPPDES
jgi:negative regulator of genetic competence, sporulation and motility